MNLSKNWYFSTSFIARNANALIWQFGVQGKTLAYVGGRSGMLKAEDLPQAFEFKVLTIEPVRFTVGARWFLKNGQRVQDPLIITSDSEITLK